ncbi:MAG: ATP-binding protein, partial [Candidatus Anammoxibacter sp.]
IALGLVVLIGWHTGNKTFIQIIPVFVPMQYNTAIGFVLCGSSMLLEIFKYRRYAAIVGVFTMVLGLLTLVQYIMNANFGIDELFMRHTIEVGTSHPGRMAPNTALCFVLFSSCMAIHFFFRKQVYHALLVAVLGSIVFGLSLVALSGYMFQLESAYGWSNLTRMAVHTSSGFVVLSVGSLFLIWSNEITNKVIIPRWLPVTVGISVLSVTICFWMALQSSYHSSTIQEGRINILLTTILITGTLLALVLALVSYLAQVATARAHRFEIANQNLCDEIEARTKAEETIRKLSQAVEQSPASVMITDTDGVIEYVNPRFCELTGFTFEEAVGQNASLVKSGENSAEKYKELWGNITSGKLWVGELRNRNKNGELYWELAYISPIRNNENEIKNFVAVKEDITDRKHVEQELAMERISLEKRVEKRTNELHISLQKLNENYATLQRVETTRDAMTHMIVHDLRSPLAAVKGASQLLQITNDKESVSKNVPRIIAAVQNMEDLIKDILDVSKLESGEMPVSLSSLNIAQIINDVYELFAPQAEKRNIQFNYTLKSNNIPAMADKTLLSRILQNLVSNGLKHTDDSLTIVVETDDKDVIISVNDNGSGIPDKYADRVFDKYFQIEAGQERKIYGVGLGLAFCKMAIEAQKGSIWVESEEGKGSSFKVKINMAE